MVIAEALHISGHHFTFEPDEAAVVEAKRPNPPGQICLDTVNGRENVENEMAWLTKAAEGSNDFAQYTLAKLYLSRKDVPKDVPKAMELLTKSAARHNQYAQYALDKLYLMGHEVPRDREAALKWLTASAAQGNIYAQFFLDRMDSFRDLPVLLAATRLMHHLGRIFRDEQRKAGSGMQIDRKLRKKLAEKKAAQGHAYNDHEPR